MNVLFSQIKDDITVSIEIQHVKGERNSTTSLS